MKQKLEIRLCSQAMSLTSIDLVCSLSISVLLLTLVLIPRGISMLKAGDIRLSSKTIYQLLLLLVNFMKALSQEPINLQTTSSSSFA